MGSEACRRQRPRASRLAVVNEAASLVYLGIRHQGQGRGAACGLEPRARALRGSLLLAAGQASCLS